MTQGQQTSGTHAVGTKDQFAFDFRKRACTTESTAVPSAEEVEVHPAADGVVADARFDHAEGINALETVNYVVVEHPAVVGGKRLFSLYAHLATETVAPVRAGDRVTRATVIGRIGASGTSAAHLHFQLQTMGEGACGSVTPSRPRGDYPFCQSVSLRTVSTCGFVDAPGATLASGWDLEAVP